MREIEKKTFWAMPHMKESQRTSRAMLKWKPKTGIALIGARIILLTDQCMQETLDIYGAVTRNPRVDYKHGDLKKDHLFYGQRDCYTRSSGMKDLLLRVREKMKDTLTEMDYGTLSSGGIRWQNRAQWQRLRLIGKGYLKKRSERGIWEITDEGRKYLQSLKTGKT